jgi:hypothetical protein
VSNPLRRLFRKVAEKGVQGVEKTTSVLYDKTLGKQIAKLPLAAQAKMMEQFINTPIPTRGLTGGGMTRDKMVANARAGLLDSMPKDVRVRIAKGENQEQIKAYFWGCPEFQHLWAKTLGMEEATLDELIRGTLAGEG